SNAPLITAGAPSSAGGSRSVAPDAGELVRTGPTDLLDSAKDLFGITASTRAFSPRLLPTPALRERGHRGLARGVVAVHRMPPAGGGGGGFGGLGGGGLGGRGGKMATRKVKCVLVVVISVLFCPNLLRQRGRAWETATTAAAAKAAANNS